MAAGAWRSEREEREGTMGKRKKSERAQQF
jgi:hypothetical protein